MTRRTICLRRYLVSLEQDANSCKTALLREWVCLLCTHGRSSSTTAQSIWLQRKRPRHKDPGAVQFASFLSHHLLTSTHQRPRNLGCHPQTHWMRTPASRGSSANHTCGPCSLKNEIRSLPRLPFPSYKENSTLWAPGLWGPKAWDPSESPWSPGDRGKKTQQLLSLGWAHTGQARPPHPESSRPQAREVAILLKHPKRQMCLPPGRGAGFKTIFVLSCIWKPAHFTLWYQQPTWNEKHSLWELICSVSEMWKELLEDLFYFSKYFHPRRRRRILLTRMEWLETKHNKNHAKMPVALFFMVLSVFKDRISCCQL